MKLKTIIIFAATLLLVFVIYLTTIDKKIYYVDLNDQFFISNNNYSYDKLIKKYLTEEKKFEKAINHFDMIDYRTTDLINMINENKSIILNNKKQTIKNALIKSDLVTITIGMNDIYYKIGNTSDYELYNYIDEMLNDIEEMLVLVREYCKEDIIFIGYYNKDQENNNIFEYLNDKVEKISESLDIKYLNLTSILNDSDFDGRFVNEIGNQKIYYKIQQIIKQNILK